MSVAASFVWRCLSGPAIAPFPHPAHRTGHADLPGAVAGWGLHPLEGAALSRRTWNAVIRTALFASC